MDDGIEESPIVTALKRGNETAAARKSANDAAVDPADGPMTGAYLLSGFVSIGEGEEGCIRLYLSSAQLDLTTSSYFDIMKGDVLDIDQPDRLGPARIWVRRGAPLRLGGPNAIEAVLRGELPEWPPGIEAIRSHTAYCP